jgi:cytochrome c oxidase cbb3-type subunit II
MNYGPLIFIGLLVTMGWSWYGFIFKNYMEIGRQEPVELATGERYPGGRAGITTVGQEVYQANGCASCHTMQVRMKGYGADIERHWGRRASVLQDFVYDEHVFLGQVRLGPDLADVGTRLPDRNFHLMHLYNPRTTVEGSMMPQYPYLFEKRKIRGSGSPNALQLPDKFAPPAGYEIVPTRDADALAQYLLSLHAQTALFEAPILPPPVPTNTTANATAPAVTNSAAQGSSPQ